MDVRIYDEHREAHHGEGNANNPDTGDPCGNPAERYDDARRGGCRTELTAPTRPICGTLTQPRVSILGPLQTVGRYRRNVRQRG